MDLEKLSPAPWQGKGGVPGLMVRADGAAILHFFQGTSEVAKAEALTNLEFVALARNAFEVMMRRGWNPNLKSIGVWVVETQAGTWVYRRERDGGDGSRVEAADPFTALVEADRWYREHAEAT